MLLVLSNCDGVHTCACILGSSLVLIVFIVLQKGTPPGSASDRDNNQPHIVVFIDEVDLEIGQCFISVEQQLMMEAPSLLIALFNFIAAHYIFNLSYHSKISDLAVFIQAKILKIESDGKTKKILPLVSSHISGIMRMYNETEKKTM